MTFQSENTVTLYVALGNYDGDVSHIGSCHTHIDGAADDMCDALQAGYVSQAWVLEVQTGRDVTEAAKARVRNWCNDRSDDWPEWAAPTAIAAE